MAKIFSHTDGDGDVIDVFSDSLAPLCIEVKPVDDQGYIGYLDREAVKALWTALGEWLHPDAGSAPLPYANQSLIEQMIQRAVKDQVAAALPLHLTPMAHAVCAAQGGCEAAAHDPEPHDVGHADEPDVLRQALSRVLAERPAGHPTEDEWAQAPGRRIGNDGVALPYCKESSGGCGHSWGQHTGGECKARNFDLSNRAHNPCGCTARPQAAAVHSEFDREGEPVKAKCTCHIHRHQAVDGSRECTHSGCFCRTSTR